MFFPQIFHNRDRVSFINNRVYQNCSMTARTIKTKSSASPIFRINQACDDEGSHKEHLKLCFAYMQGSANMSERVPQLTILKRVNNSFSLLKFIPRNRIVMPNNSKNCSSRFGKLIFKIVKYESTGWIIYVHLHSSKVRDVCGHNYQQSTSMFCMITFLCC